MSNEPKSSEITPEAVYQRRREFLKNAGLFTATSLAIGGGLYALTGSSPPKAKGPRNLAPLGGGLIVSKSESYAGDEDLNSFEEITTYNNFYEFGLSKEDPAENAHTLRPKPWTVTVTGEVGKPGTLGYDDLFKWFPLEERVYRFRCVEAWSMVIPWLGFPLGPLLQRFEPTSKAKYVAFTTLHDPEQMPGQRSSALDWPYLEALRLDEAMHPLTLMAVGLYGRHLPNQNGAPLRLVVPWKYGFKGIKSIVKIELTQTQPSTTWSLAAPSEYGFFANVNPDVDHPRWTQKTERRIGTFGRRKTLPFNGYADQVASLYAGMDPEKLY